MPHNDDHWKLYTEWKKPDTLNKRIILYDSFYMKYPEQAACWVETWIKFDKLPIDQHQPQNNHLFLGFFGELSMSVPLSLGIFPDEYNLPVKPAMLLSGTHQSWHLEETRVTILPYSVFQVENQA